ncbi:hypothetical protein HRED_02935 [Candidatus Haloredivivus sp. G17]|nr:hypothetical protein HRED_02935 [Candidatus Haloredivivus sp. G17]
MVQRTENWRKRMDNSLIEVEVKDNKVQFTP